MSTVLVTGAAGRIGTTVCTGLHRGGWTVRGTDLAALPDGVPGASADLTDPSSEAVLAGLLDGADAVLHLAGIPGEDTWSRILAANIDATQRVLASSNHATGFTCRPATGPLPADAALRPDTFYSVCKVAMEAMLALVGGDFATRSLGHRSGQERANNPRLPM